MRESVYQRGLIQRIQDRFPGCIVLKNDPRHLQGVPDLAILYRERWAALEVKKSENEPVQPNQDYYVETMSEMSYAAYIYPENEEEVLSELQHAFRPSRKARVSQS